jgi:hypothetical protein
VIDDVHAPNCEGVAPWASGHHLVRQSGKIALTVRPCGSVGVELTRWRKEFFDAYGRDAAPDRSRWKTDRNFVCGIEDLWRLWEIGAAEGWFT